MKYLMYAPIVFLIMISCRKVIKLDDEDIDPKIVVNSEMYADSLPLFSLSISQSVLDDSYPKQIVNGEVMLKNITLGSVEYLTNLGDGRYVGSNSILENSTYEVEVSAPDFKSVNGKTIIPNAITQLQVDESDLSNNNIGMSFHSGNEDSFYGVYIAGVDSLGYESSFYLKSSSPVFQGELGVGDNIIFGEGLLFTNKNYLNSDINIVISMPYQSFVNYETLKVSLFSFSKDAYLYNKSIYSYYWSQGDPFSQPVQVYTNIEKGLGIIMGKSLINKEINL